MSFSQSHIHSFVSLKCDVISCLQKNLPFGSKLFSPVPWRRLKDKLFRPMKDNFDPHVLGLNAPGITSNQNCVYQTNQNRCNRKNKMNTISILFLIFHHSRGDQLRYQSRDRTRLFE